MSGIALVAVEADELALIGQEERLPDRRQPVIRFRLAAGCDVRDEGPGQARVGARVQVDLGVAEVCGDGIPRRENGSGLVACQRLVEEVEEGLVAEAPVVDLVVYLRDLGPGFTVIAGPVDGKIDQWWFGTVVFPCC